MACASLLTDDNILRFRTRLCLRMLQGSCSFGDDRCQYSHSQVWTRRPPYYASPSFRHERLDATHRGPLLRYLPVPCEHLLIGNGEVKKVTCQRGVNCPFAHSPEEIAYHPLVYKSVHLYLIWLLLSVPVNYPGATLVELPPNKGGRRRRQRPATSVAAGLLGKGSSGSKTASLQGAATHQGSQLRSQLVRQLTDCSKTLEAPPPREDGPRGDVQKGGEDTTNNDPPLASLLSLFDARPDVQLHSWEVRGFSAHGGDRCTPKRNATKQTSRRESLYLSGGFAMQQHSLPEPLGEELPLRTPAELLVSAQQQRNVAYPHLRERVEFEGPARSSGQRGNASSESLNSVSCDGSSSAYRSLSPLRNASSQLNLFGLLDEFCGKRNPQPEDAFGLYGLPHMHQAASGNNFVWKEDRGAPPHDAMDEGFDPFSAFSWATSSSAEGSLGDTARCSSWSTRPSQSSLPNTSFSELDLGILDDLKGGSAASEGSDRAGNSGFTDKREGSFSPDCFSLEGSSGAGRTCKWMQRDGRFSGYSRTCEELPLFATGREGERCSEEWEERGLFWQAASAKAPESQLRGEVKKKETLETADLQGEVEEGGLSKAGGPSLGSRETPLPADDAANYYSQLLTLWKTARHGHAFSAGVAENAQEQHSREGQSSVLIVGREVAQASPGFVSAGLLEPSRSSSWPEPIKGAARER
ncbi:hypothetical protein ACSSS7_001629 [Eimeria intestinalis]